MANNQYNKALEGGNHPTYGYKPTHLSHLLNQTGGSQGSGHDQAWGETLPEMMHQGGDTKHPSAHPEGHMKKPRILGNMMGQR